MKTDEGQLASAPAESAAGTGRADRATVSVIVPVRNEEQFIERTLQYLLDQDRDGLHVEILVVDGESDDRTPEIVRGISEHHPEVRLLANPRRWSSAARNIGVRASTGDLVLIVDGHCEITDRQHLRKLVTAFESSQADCLGRPQPLDVTNATRLQRAVAAVRASRLGHHPESLIYASHAQFVPARSVAVAYRRSVFDRVGYFDEQFDAHEDGEFNFRVDRAGLRCYFTPDIAVNYWPRGSLRGLFRQMVRYGRGRMQLYRKHRTGMSIGTVVPALFVLGIVSGLPLSFLSPWLALAYLGTLTLYCLAVGLITVREAWRAHSWSLLVLMPMVVLTVHLGAGAGVLIEVPRPSIRYSPAERP